ncbi:MAG: hypothetical protein WA654_18225, partial [Candidatus Sulfotelmatobacter sp.]
PVQERERFAKQVWAAKSRERSETERSETERTVAGAAKMVALELPRRRWWPEPFRYWRPPLLESRR